MTGAHDLLAASEGNDAYVFIGETNVTSFTQPIFGIAASEDLLWQGGNEQDELALVFADSIKDFIDLIQGLSPDDIRIHIQHMVANLAVHEAFHTFTFIHTLDNDTINVQDVIKKTPDFFVSHSNPLYHNPHPAPVIVTRWDALGHEPLPQMPHPNQPKSPILPNNYELAMNVLGPRDDSGAIGVPDMAYVTGTGAHDVITLTALANGTVDVNVEAFDDPDHTISLGSYNYPNPINLATDTDGLILVEPSRGDDKIIVDGDFTVGNPNAQIKIRAAGGNDELLVESDAVISKVFFEGEGGNDSSTSVAVDATIQLDLNGGSGVDTLNGGAGDDVLSGGVGDDVLYGGDGSDILEGGEGKDIMAGGDGGDIYKVIGENQGSGDELIDSLELGSHGVAEVANVVEFLVPGWVEMELEFDPNPFDGLAESQTLNYSGKGGSGGGLNKPTTTMAIEAIDRLFEAVATSSTDLQWDIDGDGDIDGHLTTNLDGAEDVNASHSDIDRFILVVLGTNYGDTNLDGVVDAEDLNEIGLNWYMDLFFDSWGLGDLNGDGEINATDLNIFGQNQLWWNVESNPEINP